jgi:hypothetical protein
LVLFEPPPLPPEWAEDQPSDAAPLGVALTAGSAGSNVDTQVAVATLASDTMKLKLEAKRKKYNANRRAKSGRLRAAKAAAGPNANVNPLQQHNQQQDTRRRRNADANRNSEQGSDVTMDQSAQRSAGPAANDNERLGAQTPGSGSSVAGAPAAAGELGDGYPPATPTRILSEGPEREGNRSSRTSQASSSNRGSQDIGAANRSKQPKDGKRSRE